MDIQEIKDRKTKMDNEIFQAVGKAVNDFEAETGVQVESVDVHFIEILRIGVRGSSVILDQVSSTLAI